MPARHWLAIDLCHLSGRFKVSIPDLADFKLHFSQIAYSERAERERERGEGGGVRAAASGIVECAGT